MKLFIIITRNTFFTKKNHCFWYSADLGSEMKRWVINSQTAKTDHVPSYAFHWTVAYTVLQQQTPLTRDLLDMVNMPFVEPEGPKPCSHMHATRPLIR
jgi:hypothetical protein